MSGVFGNPWLYKHTSQFYEYEIDQSLRFNDADNAYLQRTPSTGNEKTWTWSGWIKRGSLGSGQGIFGTKTSNTTNFFILQWLSNDALFIQSLSGGSQTIRLSTTKKFRDTSAFYHIVVATDTTQSTASNRLKIYVNGELLTAYDSGSEIYPTSQNLDTFVNDSSFPLMVGAYDVSGTPDTLSGQLAEVNFIDGTAYAASNFGKFNDDIWIPKSSSGLSFGTNGFYLPFSVTAGSSMFDPNNDSDVVFSNSSVYDIGTADFTMEWFDNSPNYATNSDMYAFGEYGGSYLLWEIQRTSSALYLYLYTQAGGAIKWTCSNIAGDTWHHFALQRDGTVLRFYINGVRQTTVGNAGGSTGFTYSDGKVTDFNKNYSDISAFNFGDAIANQNGYTGLKSNFRWVAGSGNNIYANNDSNITVPTSTLANVTGTVLLAFTTSDITKDSSSNNVSGSNSGCSHDTNNPFSPTIGNDLSGNNNDYASNGLNFTDVLLDSPTLNFANISPLHTLGTLTEANLKYTTTSTDGNAGLGSFSLNSSGTEKFYWEAVPTATSQSAYMIGIGTINNNVYNNTPSAAYNSSGLVYTDWSNRGNKGSYTTNDIIGFTFDASNGQFRVYKNGTLKATETVANNTSKDLFVSPMTVGGGGTSTWVFNFGQDSSFAGAKSAQGNADENGNGDFYYAPPSGFLGMMSASLPQGSISPAGDSLAENNFNTVIYAGDGNTTKSVDIETMNPDFVWIKSRSSGSGHHSLINSVAGDRALNSNQTIAEYGVSSFSFNSDNTIDVPYYANDYSMNTGSATYVAWNWKAGGKTPVKTYKVRVAATGQGNRYQFRNSADSANFNQSQVTLDLQEGGTYTFDLSNSTVDGHPMKFSTTSNGSHGGGTTYSTGVVYKLDGVAVSETDYVSNFNSATSRTVAITVAASAPTLYYFCHYHSAMGGQINTNSTNGSTNFDGSTLSVVSANVTAGFSIVNYTGTGSATTVGHDLGFAPSVIILKRRNSADDWLVYHSSRGASAYLTLNSTGVGETGVSYPWNGTSPTSSVFSVNSGGSVSSATMVAYCFHSVEGYSKFSSYVGNGNSNGTVVFTGFRPAFVIWKRADSTGPWGTFDSTRDIDNTVGQQLNANATDAEGTTTSNNLDFLSNGFKLRGSATNSNASGGTYIYIAFAEQPFKYANAR